MSKDIVRNHMTPAPHTIGAGQTLTSAHALMRKHGVRHLPVLDGGALAGLIPQRDLYLLETLRDVNPDTVTVEEAMTPDPLVVTPEAELASVVEGMAEHKFGSAVVVEQGKVVGVFTTIDALRILAGLLREREPAKKKH